MKRSTQAIGAALEGALLLVAGAAGAQVFDLTDEANPATTGRIQVDSDRGPYGLRLQTVCDGGGDTVTILGLNNRVTAVENASGRLRIDHNVKGLPAFMRITVASTGYNGTLEPSRADRCSLIMETREGGRGRGKLDCRPLADGLGMNPFPNEATIDAIQNACRGEKGVSIGGQLKRVKVFLNGSSVEAQPPS